MSNLLSSIHRLADGIPPKEASWESFEAIVEWYIKSPEARQRIIGEFRTMPKYRGQYNTCYLWVWGYISLCDQKARELQEVSYIGKGLVSLLFEDYKPEADFPIGRDLMCAIADLCNTAKSFSIEVEDLLAALRQFSIEPEPILFDFFQSSQLKNIMIHQEENV